jgi:hypothetical protein
MSAANTDEKVSATSFSAYSEYNKILRTWFVAFGIGGPSLFLLNSGITAKLVQANNLKTVVILFLAGTAAQVLGAIVNKFSNWYVYRAYGPEGEKESQTTRVAVRLAAAIWLDITVDLITFFTFGYALWLMFAILS